ncbi:MAG: ABC transporter substrate-binding protein [Acidobacteria bacterium]|nr:MAG: ABC transporter substrate-binding protein [Acidobacteriota bacterium]
MRSLHVSGPLALAFALAACGPRGVREPPTLVLMDIGPSINRQYVEWRRQALEDFTRETGIVVRQLPAPESSDEQLVFDRQLLEGGATTPDVYVIDATWPGTLGEHLLDLRPRLGAEAAEHFPALVANNVVRGRMVAMPYHANVGILFFRTDLLREYGYRDPPGTWDELEAMATAIQKGERTKGDQDFWGYVWEGAPYEGLTCNALEWQASEGGGRIVEDDGTISVNNPRAIKAWDRAAAWIGAVSPPEVLGYREADAENAFRAGKAAFMRNWPSNYSPSQGSASRVRGRFDITFVPRGSGGHAMALGENALAVSRYSLHLDEAVALVKYLSRRDVQLARSRLTSLPPTLPDLYDEPGVLTANPYYAPLKMVFLGGALSRPSAVTGLKYAEVSRAYFRAVHSVLTRQQKAPAALASLERELAWITGLPARAAPRARRAPTP